MKRLDIVQNVENISNVRDQRILVNSAIQTALDRLFSYHDFPYYLQEGTIKTADDYSTGTVAITALDTTATITTGVVSAYWVGRKIRFSGDNPYYRIKSVDTGLNTITLQDPYQGSTLTTGTYQVYQDEYRLAPDVDKYKTLRQIQNAISLISLHPTKFDERVPAPSSLSDPAFEIMSGTKLDVYTTGTVSTSGNTITGVSTDWLNVEGLGRMSNLRIGTNVYTVKSVDSGTQITTYEILVNASGATYEIILNNLCVQLYQIPDAQRLLYYRYFRIPALLANDYDIPDMPHEWHWVLQYGALSIVLMQKGDLAKAQQEAEVRFLDGLERMKLKLGSFTPDRSWKRKSIDRSSRGDFGDGLEESKFGARYSI